MHTHAVFHMNEMSADKNTDQYEIIHTIDGESAKLSIPRNVLRGTNKMRHVPVRIASFLFRNMSRLLPERFNENDTLYICACISGHTTLFIILLS